MERWEYICDFSRSVGAGSATTRKMRGLTRSVIALIVPPLPAPSRPSKMMQTFKPACTTHCWSLTNSTCKRASFRSYSFRFSLSPEGVRAEAEEHTSELQSHLNLVCRLLLALVLLPLELIAGRKIIVLLVGHR